MIFIAKKEKVSVPKDLRPIILISGWCKVAEKLFINRLVDRSNKQNFFNINQYGFVKGRSTVNAIDALLNKIDINLPKFKYNVLISIDVSGAFDNISWKHILNNISRSGIEKQYLLSAENLLIDRKIYINSNLYDTIRGCPQGGCASPSL